MWHAFNKLNVNTHLLVAFVLEQRLYLEIERLKGDKKSMEEKYNGKR